jgi:hypothetical protein
MPDCPFAKQIALDRPGLFSLFFAAKYQRN